MYLGELLGFVYPVAALGVALEYLILSRSRHCPNQMLSSGLLLLIIGLILAILYPVFLFIVVVGILFVVLSHNASETGPVRPYSSSGQGQAAGRRIKKRSVKVIAVCAVIVLIAAAITTYYVYAFEHNMLDSRPGIDCPAFVPGRLSCQALISSWGRVVAVKSTTYPGWFLGIGQQPKEEITVFVPSTNTNFTTSFLGCSNAFHIGDNLSLIIAAYNATYVYNGYPEYTGIADSQVTNNSLDKSTTITYSGTLTTVINEIGRIYFVVDIPMGCAQG